MIDLQNALILIMALESHWWQYLNMMTYFTHNEIGGVLQA